MTRRTHPGRFALALAGLAGLAALAALAGCSAPPSRVPPDGGWGPDGGGWGLDGGWVPDGGWWPDGGGPMPDGGNPHEPVTVLRPTIGLDLAQVSAFVVVSGQSGAQPPHGGGLSPMDGEEDAGVPSGPQLLALTLSGETLTVTLVEDGSPEGGGVVRQPDVMAIVPTATWILFLSPGFSAFKLHEDGTSELVGCSIIAARRADGALYCAPLVVGFANVIDPRFAGIQVNAAGDVAYAMAAVLEPGAPGPVTTDYFLYKLELGGVAGPTASLATTSQIHTVNYFLANAAGDLLVNYFPVPMDQGFTRTQVLPADGSDAFTLQGTHDAFAICGQPGDVDEDTFYLTVGGGGGVPSDGTIPTVTREGGTFVETQQSITMADVNQYGGLYRLADGVYMFSKGGKSIARVIADGAVIAAPTPIVITGVDQLLDIQGIAIAATGGHAVFVGLTGTTYSFIRHDGLTRQDIPLDPNIELWSVRVGRGGVIDFTGFRSDTQENVRGTVAAGSTEVTIMTSDTIDPAEVVVFTRIN